MALSLPKTSLGSRFSIVPPNERIALKGGYDFYLDQTIKSYSLEHGRPNGWEEKNAIHGPYQEIRKAYVENPTLS